MVIRPIKQALYRQEVQCALSIQDGKLLVCLWLVKSRELKITRVLIYKRGHIERSNTDTK